MAVNTLTQEDLTQIADTFGYVTPQMCGAVCDGVTDDSAAFALAVTKASNEKKKLLISGTLAIKEDVDISVLSSVVICGASGQCAGAPSPGSSDASSKIVFYDGAKITTYIPTSITWRDVTFVSGDYTKAVAATEDTPAVERVSVGTAFLVKSYKNTWENCTFCGFDKAFVLQEGAFANGNVNTWCGENKIISCTFTDCNRGINVTDSNISDNMVKDNICTSTCDYFIYAEKHLGFWLITGNHDYAKHGSLLVLTGGVVSNNYFDGIGKLRLRGACFTFSSNTFLGTQAQYAQQVGWFNICGTVEKATFTANACYTPSSDKVVFAYIENPTNGSTTYVSNNRFTGNAMNTCSYVFAKPANIEGEATKKCVLFGNVIDDCLLEYTMHSNLCTFSKEAAVNEIRAVGSMLFGRYVVENEKINGEWIPGTLVVVAPHATTDNCTHIVTVTDTDDVTTTTIGRKNYVSVPNMNTVKKVSVQSFYPGQISGLAVPQSCDYNS